MAVTRFNSISRLFESRRSWRGNAVHQATPSATDTVTPAASSLDEKKTEFLFVQSFQSGIVAPTEGQDGRYTVTLEHGLGQTIYFSDRPDRVVGATPTERFLGGIGFREDNPPNAALVLERGAGETDLAVVELYEPVYDESTRTLTYEVEVLESWQESLDLGFTDAPADLATLAPAFGAAHLFIDDCPDGDLKCVVNGAKVGTISDHGGYCYSWSAGNCYTCSPDKDDFAADVVYWSSVCNQTFRECGGNCVARNVCGGGFLCPAGDNFNG